jgi:PGDYG protein
MKFTEIYEDATEEITDAWFDDPAGFDTYKKPAPVKYQRATEPGTVDTLEGPMRYEAGHYIMTGPKGEQYPITAEKFDSLYDDNNNGTATPKKIMKRARLADRDGVIHTSWGDLEYSAGHDILVKHGHNDYGVVKPDIFQQTYAKV